MDRVLAGQCRLRAAALGAGSDQARKTPVAVLVRPWGMHRTVTAAAQRLSRASEPEPCGDRGRLAAGGQIEFGPGSGSAMKPEALVI